MSDKILYILASFLHHLIGITVATYHFILTKSQFLKFRSFYFFIWLKLLSLPLCKEPLHFSHSQVTSTNDLRIAVTFEPVATMVVCSQLHYLIIKHFLKIKFLK